MSNPAKPVVVEGVLKTDADSIGVGTVAWYEWLSTARKFAFRDDSGRFVARSQMRRNKTYWYAERRLFGQLAKTYLGRSEELTLEKLQAASRTLAGNPPASRTSGELERADKAATEQGSDASFLPLTKVTAPLLPRELVSRTRLIRRINTPLTLICAASGFGKSTLLNDWKQTCGFPVAWLTLDERDNNPVRFWYSVVTALQAIEAKFCSELLTYIRSTSSIAPAEAVLHLTNAIVAQKQFPRLGIVLDDFHFINHSEIYDAIQIWLRHFPANLQLVIAGHTRPPLALGDLRARRMVTELDTSDLRFSTAEGVEYLKRYLQEGPLAQQDLEKLVRHSEGWAAGLALSALAVAKEEDRRQFIDTFSGAHIYMREYFMETVLKRCTAETQAFLLRTAILKDLTGDLCDAVTGQTGGVETLARLWQENLFIVRLAREGWYRYHDLFAEMLRSQLKMRFPEEVPVLHQAAAQWYHQQYALADAIHHLLSIEAWEDAATLTEEMALRELEQFGEDSRLLRWLQELPPGVVQKHKNLLFVYMRLANIALPQEKIVRFISDIERSLSTRPAHQLTQDEREVLAEIEQIRQMRMAGQAFVPPARAGNEYDARWDLLDRLYLLRPAYRQSQNFPEEPVAGLLREAIQSRNLFVALMAGGVLAKRVYFGGELRRSERICRQVVDQAVRQRGSLPETASLAFEVQGLLHLERNEIGLAQRSLAQAREVDPNPTSTNMPIHFALLQAKIHLALDQREEALAAIQSARAIQMRHPGGLLESEDLLAYEALISVRVGGSALAEQLLLEAGDVMQHHLLRQVEAEIYLSQARYGEAEALLSDTIERYAQLIVIEPLLETRIFLALARFGQHKIKTALQVMTEAIRLAAPERFLRPFLNGGAACVPLLRLALESGNLSGEAEGFVKELMRLMPRSGEQPRLAKAEFEALTTSASISAREQEILQLLSAWYTSREIAARLSISESTVKTHLGSIYSKLDVHSRGEAVSRARQLQLIP